MKAKNEKLALKLSMIVITAAVLCSGCATTKTVPPLFSSPPQLDLIEKPKALEIRTPPPVKSVSIEIDVLGKEASISPENFIMRKGAKIKAGSSVVISVPASVYHPSQESAPKTGNGTSFPTEGYFNVLEQYIERGLISAGFHVKDRSKFEAKLRDLRDSSNTVRSSDSYTIAIAGLKKEMDAGRLSEVEFAEKSKVLRDTLLDPPGGSRNREEMTDISEVVRAAQSGDVIADYILQVNELSVQHYSGSALQLSTKYEVQRAVSQNPGLRLGTGPNMIPATLSQPWAQARFNAKLIDVKTGGIDWIGDYSIDSLNVLDDGIRITIAVRRRTVDSRAITDAITDYNNRLQKAYEVARDARKKLESLYAEAMKSVEYNEGSEEGAAIQNRRKSVIKDAEEAYHVQRTAYNTLAESPPKELKMDWRYEYDVDAPVVSPDLLHPRTEEERRRVLDHVKALGSRVTRELLRTIRIDGY